MALVVLMQNLPERPDITPAPKKRSKWAIAASVIGGLIVLSALSGLGSDDTDPVDTPTSVTSDTTYEVSAQDVVDFMGQEQIDAFCTAYDALGDYSLALEQFTEGYGTDENPSAEEVFDELLVRC
jgi:hypothetical protein